jgi:hypothetical protein
LGSTAGFIAAAKSCLGVPYVYGGANPATGLDCSGLVYYAAGTQGVSVPRTTQGEWSGLTPVATPIPGDLILYDVPSDGPPQPQHVIIYLGPNLAIQAPHTGLSVMYSTIPNDAEESIMGYRRIDFGPAPAPTAADSFEEMLAMPVFTNAGLVRWCYWICLKRDPDPAGYATFTNYLDGGGTWDGMMTSLLDSPEGVLVKTGQLRSGI